MATEPSLAAEIGRTAETLWDALNREEVELDSGVSWEEVVSSTLQSVDLAYRASGAEARVSLHACWVDWIIQQWAHVDSENARLAAEIAALKSRSFEDGARPKVLATGWLKSMGRRDGEERGPVVEFVVDASQEHAMTFGDIWNGRFHQIAALSDASITDKGGERPAASSACRSDRLGGST